MLVFKFILIRTGLKMSVNLCFSKVGAKGENLERLEPLDCRKRPTWSDFGSLVPVYYYRLGL